MWMEQDLLGYYQIIGYYSKFDDRGVYVIEKLTSYDSLYVRLDVGVYDIYYVVDDDVVVPSGYRTRSVEDSITLPIPSRKCYVFDGWYDNKNLEGNPVQGIGKGVYGDKSFWAKWKDDPDSCPESSSSEQESSSSSVLESSSSASRARNHMHAP